MREKSKPRLLELFAGIGAVSHALCERFDVTAAIDINELAATVYRSNFETPYLCREINSLSFDKFAAFGADMWWMSPPCQPFTRRGKQNDLNDPRSAGLLHIIAAIKAIRPGMIGMENVVGFENSQAFQQLTKVLDEAGYHWQAMQLCSSQFGLPNLRPRFFLTAELNASQTSSSPEPQADSRFPVSIETRTDNTPHPLSDFLLDSENTNPQLQVSQQQLLQYHEAINIVRPKDTVSRCFTSAYGKSIVRSGSYLEMENGFRRFAPREMARLLGFGDDFELPESLSTRQLWKLLGNSISIPCLKFATAVKSRSL